MFWRHLAKLPDGDEVAEGAVLSIVDGVSGFLVGGVGFKQSLSIFPFVRDFFAWPTEVGGLPLLRTLARRIARFKWQEAPNDVASILYETVIPPDERRQLGEYYTPVWLARAIVREVVTDPLEQYVLDPACGSGTFVAEAVNHFIEAANETSLDPKEVLEWLRFSVAGIDVHPVAVHLARAAWVLAAQPAIQAAVEDGFAANITVPVYLGDALQLRFRTGDMFAEHNITVQVEDEDNTELVFPVSLVDRAETFDALMSDIAEAIEGDDDPNLAPRRPPDRGTWRAASSAEDHRLHAEAARRGPQPHLGVLHSQSGSARRALSQQSRCHRRQPTLADLSEHRQHAAD